MKTGKGGLITFSGGCMSLVWRYAWANFVTIVVFHRPFPPFESIAAFGLAWFLTFVSLGRGWRIIQILGLQFAGFLLVFLRIVYVLHECSHPFMAADWLLEFIHRSREPLEWLFLFLILCWTILFWFGGVSLAKKPKAYLKVCARFDIGVSFLFALFLVKFVTRVKGGPAMEESLSEIMLFPFFLFGLFAIGLARSRGTVQRGFISGYRGVGVVLTFSAVVLLFGTGFLLLFYAYLTMAAETGYALLKVAARPMGPVLVGILRFLFAPRNTRMDALQRSHGMEMPIPEEAVDPGWWTGPVGEVIRYLLLCIAAIGLMALISLFLWLLFKWLLSKTPSRNSLSGGWSMSSLLAKIWEILSGLFLAAIDRGKKKRRGAVQLYASLLGWGRRSGMPSFMCETPMEYGRRLIKRFPDLGSEITAIIEVFNQDVYGGRSLGVQTLAPAKRAWSHLRSPLQWPRRLKTWFLQT